ncbi:MAG: class I SAM-dependent methyltransferase, partial [Acidobacteriota bacterium]|nr:class I SAM-dependent methyltransferase [Acidobacteriota bacterium]
MSCPACSEGTLESFFRVESAPGNSCLLMESAEEARAYPRGTIDLGFCSRCGFISNQAIDLSLTEYSGRYEETQGFSPTFRKFHERLARDLIERHDLRNKHVVEIGCGKGEFLHMLCAFGDNDGLGFDPSYIEGREQPIRGERVRFITEYFSSDQSVDEADFVACKMTLEHIPECREFMSAIRHSVHGQPDTVVFIQVPEATRILTECAFEDIYYEHCSYFTPYSLRRLFDGLGFEVVR